MPQLMQATRRALRAPVRNRYFWGKLLDAEHLELEQRYNNEKRWLLNRHAHGTGVLCGLDVEPASENRLWIRPGVALDGLGREIVVPESFCIEDPTQPTDACGEPDGAPVRDGSVWICLAYHECDIEPVRALVDGCDPRDGCRANAVRERFRVRVHRTPPPVPETVLDGVREGDLAGLSSAEIRASLDQRSNQPGSQKRSNQPGSQKRSNQPGSQTRLRGGRLARPLKLLLASRSLVCGIWAPGCGPAELECVPIAEASVSPNGELTLKVCGLRRLIPSNANLLDGLLLAASLVVAKVESLEVESLENRPDAEQGQLSLGDGDEQSALAGSTLSPISVHAHKTTGPTAGVDIRFHVVEGAGVLNPSRANGSASRSECWVTTDKDGVATVTWQLGSAPGPNVVEAVLGTGPGRIGFTATAT